MTNKKLKKETQTIPFKNKFNMKKFLYYASFFLFLTAPLIFINNAKDYVNAPKAGYIQIFVFFIFALSLFKNIKDGKISFKKNLLNIPIASLIVWSLFSAVYATNPYESLKMGAHWLAASIFFLFLVNNINKKKIENLLYAIFASGILVSLTGILQHLFDFDIVIQVSKPASFFANKNMAMHFVVLTLPLGLAFFLKSKTNDKIWLFSFCTSLFFIYALYTTTRASWIAIIAEVFVIVVVCIINKKKIFWNKIKTIAVFAMIFFVFIGFGLSEKKNKNSGIINKIDSATKTGFDPTGSAMIRLHVWKSSINFIKKNFIFGVGLENYKIVSPIYNVSLYIDKVVNNQEQIEKGHLFHVHNDFIEFFAELGVVGFLLFIWLGICIFYILFKIIFPKKHEINFEDLSNKEKKFIRKNNTAKIFAQKDSFNFEALGIFIAMIGFCFSASFSFPMHMAIPPFILMSFAAFSVIYYETNEASYIFETKTVPFAIFLHVCVILIFLIVFHKNNIEFERARLKLNILLKSQRWNMLITEAHKATTINKFSNQPYFFSGLSYMKLGRTKEALRDFQKISKTRPNGTPLMLNMANAYLRSGDYGTSIKMYKKILEMKPTLIKARQNLSGLYFGLKKKKLAINELLIANKIKPETSVMLDIALIYMYQGEHEKASYFFSESLNIRNDLIATYSKRAAVYNMKRKNYKEVINAYLRCIKPEGEDYSKSLHRIGVSSYNHNQKEFAISLLKKALQINPKDNYIRKHLYNMTRKSLKK